MSTFPLKPDELDGQYQSVVREVAGIIDAARQIPMKRFYLLWPSEPILQTVSEESPSQSIHQSDSAIPQTVSGESRGPLASSRAVLMALAIKAALIHRSVQ